MTISSPAHEVLSTVSLVMRALRIRWYLFGSQAVVAYGLQRSPEDVDITISLPHEQLRSFVDSMKQAGFEAQAAGDLEESFTRKRVLPFVHRRTGMPLNAVIASSLLENDVLTRAQRLELAGLEVPVISAEDLIVSKVLVGRQKDLDDARGVLEEQGEVLDVELVRGILREFESTLQRNDLVSTLEKLVPGAHPLPR